MQNTINKNLCEMGFAKQSPLAEKRKILRNEEFSYTWVIEQWNKVKRQFKIIYVEDKNENDPKLIRYVHKNVDKIFDLVTALCFALTGKVYDSINYHYAASEINLRQNVAKHFADACDGNYELRKYL
jgi:hypothetical protein